MIPDRNLPALALGGGGGIGDAAHQVVEVAQAAGQIMDVVRDETAKANEFARTENNEFNICKNFLDNTVNAIKEETLSQYNIVVCTDQANDDFQELTGQVLPMDLVGVEVEAGKTVNFQVYVFDTGKYLRHGKWERDSWWYWGQTQTFTDPAAMHVHFEQAQPKKNPDEVQQQQNANDQETETADAINAAAKGAEGQDGAEGGADADDGDGGQAEEEAQPEEEAEPENEPEQEPEQAEEPEPQEQPQPEEEGGGEAPEEDPEE